VNALINARNNGKKVTVFVEVKARFDEHANLQFAKIMKKAGIRIIYSIPGLKVHAKVALVLRKSIKGRKSAYAFLSTGNFNEKTAKLYADHGLLTSDENITSELKLLFNHLEDQTLKIKLKHLLVAQFNIKKELIKLIDREIVNARDGKPAWMILKMNGIDHKKMIDKLYEASQAGVKIDLIVRGICCVVPGEPFSENITITRIVDRYLEHARVFVFGNQGDPEIYMASADWMNRNLDSRIELCFPIYDKFIKNEVMDVLQLQLQDNTKARHLDKVPTNLPVHSEGKRKIRAQIETYKLLKA
jgi:polyphosphate kinase